MEKNKLNKPIVELDKPNGKIIKYWESAKKAAQAYQFSPVYITYNVKGTTKQAKGHYFRFATVKEIEQFEQIIQKFEKITDPNPVVIDLPLSNNHVEIIPEVIITDENQVDKLSPFERLLEAGKKKLMDNSK